MSVAHRQLLSGWGGTAPSAAQVHRPTSRAELEAIVGTAGPRPAGARRLVARGLARSYGDAAQCGGGLVVDTSGLDGILHLDPAQGRARLEAGVSIDALLRRTLPQGWFVPVTPGTRQVTVGGALAADVHGKNHHRDGSWARFVPRCTLVAPAGTLECGPDLDADAYWATAGGMGLTGVVAEMELQLLPVESAYLCVDTERAGDLDTCMARMEEGDDAYRYSVAWVDSLARGRSLGRSVLTRGDHARRDELPPRLQGPAARKLGPPARLAVPFVPPVPLVQPSLVAAFNEAWFRKAPRQPRRSVERISAFFHPLDAVTGWNRLYGPRGFLQYQFVVPPAASDVVRTALERLSSARAVSFLAVLKRFGPADEGPLSFPMPGWTLALDLPAATRGLAALLDGLDELVAGAGGRVYLAKDGRLRPELLAVMYPRLDEWRAVQQRLDPDGLLRSDLSRRLHLS